MRLVHHLALSLVLVGLAIQASPAPAVVIVNWGGDYVSTQTDLNLIGGTETVTNFNVDPLSRDNRVAAISATFGDANVDDSLQGRAFSETVQFNPQSGYSGTSSIFYGGAVKGMPNTTTLDTFQDLSIQNHGPNDTIDLRFQANGTASELKFAVYWKAQDFLNPQPFPLVIDSTSTFSVTFATNTSAQITNFGELRWIVEDGNGDWWISAVDSDGTANIVSKEESTSGGINNRTTYTSSFSELRYWAPYDPNASSGMNMNFEPGYGPETNTGTNPISYNISPNPFVDKLSGGLVFTDIRSVGLYIEDDQFTTNVLQFSIEGININLNVPEPGPIALLGVAGVGGLVYWRRRTKKRAA